MENINKLVKGAKKVKFHGKCSWFKCEEKIKGIAYTDKLWTALGFFFCSRNCIRENLKYARSEEAIKDSA